MDQRRCRILPNALTRALKLALALCLALLPAAHSFAEEAGLVVERPAGDMSYQCYQVFCAEVSDDGTATDIAWASDEMRDAVLAYLQVSGYTEWIAETHPDEGQAPIAQNAAEYLSLRIGTAEQIGNDSQPAHSDQAAFSTGLARALANNGHLPFQSVSANEQFAATEGYWLIVTDPSSLDTEGESGTSPIWLPIGGTLQAIQEKAASPTISKDVLEASSNTWGKVADAFRKESLDFRITGTLPRNLVDYTRFHYRLTDTHSDGLSIAIPEGKTIADAISITIGDTLIKPDGENLQVGYDGKALIIDFADLRSGYWEPYGITSDSSIVVTYKAFLNERAIAGSAGNSNDVTLTCSNDPTGDSESDIHATPVKVYTHTLRLRKVSSDASKPLNGAKFTVRMLRAGTKDPRQACYVQADGSFSPNACEFATDSNGVVTIEGVDSGDYTVVETVAPDGYQRLQSDIQISIKPTVSEADGHLAKLTATCLSDDAHVSSISADDGIATLTVKNTPLPKADRPVERLAQTGVGPIASTLVLCGLVVIAVSLAANRGKRRVPRRHRSY